MKQMLCMCVMGVLTRGQSSGVAVPRDAPGWRRQRRRRAPLLTPPPVLPVWACIHLLQGTIIINL